MNVGWIGLGNMGSVMARRVLEAGHGLTVFNRSADKAKELVERGARLASTPAEAAQHELVVTMLSDDTALRDVLGAGGALAAMTPRTVHVSMSTISYALAQELTESHAARGVGFVGAPVFGRPDAAAQGKLFILSGGAPAPLAACQPLFEILSQKVLPLGPAPAAAHLTKVLGNFMLISSVELLGEALGVAHGLELDPQAVLGALTGSVFSAPFFANYGRMIAEQRFDGPAAFGLELARKDLGLALAAARAGSAPLPLAEAVGGKVERLLNEGGAARDLASLGDWSRK
ncbi:MAG TPA: NAD(P)-dependent oxidoreductase [Polyangiaceae bacterium]|nr:NAD(P)-dependent oxidoreductase [Polyangiaceae bacterium]